MITAEYNHNEKNELTFPLIAKRHLGGVKIYALFSDSNQCTVLKSRHGDYKEGHWYNEMFSGWEPLKPSESITIKNAW